MGSKFVMVTIVLASTLLSLSALAGPPRVGAFSDYRACYNGIRELSSIDGVEPIQSPWQHLLVSGVDDVGVEHGESIDYQIELRGNAPRVVLLTEKKYIEIPFNAKKYPGGDQGVALKLPSGKAVILNFSVTHTEAMHVNNAFFEPGSSSITLNGSYTSVLNTNSIRSSFDAATSDFTNTVRDLVKTLPEKFVQAEKSLVKTNTFTNSKMSGVPYLKSRFDAVLAACAKAKLTEPATPDTSLLEPIRATIDEKYQYAQNLLSEAGRPHGKHATVTEIK